MTWAIDQACDSAGEKLVLLMLANYCNGHTGQCNPSHKKLAEECSMGVSTLKRHIAALETKGYLDILANSQDGVSLPNQYNLRVSNLGGVGPNRADPQPKLDGGVGPNRATNQEVKPGSKPTTSKAVASHHFDALNYLVQCGAEEQVAMDWLRIRTKRNAANTKTAFSEIIKKIGQSGLPVDDALKLCCSRNWIGFEAHWVENRTQVRGHGTPSNPLSRGLVL